MPNLYVPEPRNEEERAVLDWWEALAASTRQVFLQAVWEIEGRETPDQLEPHQKKREKKRQVRRPIARGEPLI